MSNKSPQELFVGKWINWYKGCRSIQEIYADGSFEFEAVAQDDLDGERITAKGDWKVVDGAIHWHYTETTGIPLPKKVDINPIVHIDENSFSVKEANRSQSDWYRYSGGEETSTNFDMEQVEPLLEKIAGWIDSGFGEDEIQAIMKKLKRLKPDGCHEIVYVINYKDQRDPFRIHTFMDDVDAPDIYFHGPEELVRKIDKEIEKL
jgi:hypothetical protein